MRLDGLVYGVLNTKFGVTHQYRIYSANRQKPKRIDFRSGGTNPVVIEFAVRTERHRNEAYALGNSKELHKLARQVKVKARYLLLLDLAKEPIAIENLKRSYAGVRGQRGRGARKRVRVIYVHNNDHYSFLWSVNQ